MTEYFKKIANLVGIFLHTHNLPYVFRHIDNEVLYSVEYTCNKCMITVYISKKTSEPIIWGIVQKGCIRSPMFIFPHKFEDFKTCILSKCILERVCDV
jgi:hypothetical protein